MDHENYTYKPLDVPADDKEKLYDFRPWYRKPSVYFLLPIFLLLSTTMGALMMPRTNLMISLICRQQFSSSLPPPPPSSPALPSPTTNTTIDISKILIGEHNDICSIPSVEAATTLLDLYGNILSGIIGAIMTPLWGRMSDRYGRVRIFAISTAILCAGQGVEVLMAAVPGIFGLGWIWVGFVLEGLSGTFILVMALGSAYAGDCTSISKRSTTMGLLHGSIYFGMAFGPIFGGFIGMRGGESRPLDIFYTALALNAFIVVYILLIVPESLPAENRKVSHPTSSREHKESETPTTRILELLHRLNPLKIITGLIPPEASTNPTLKRNLIAFATINAIVFATLMASFDIVMLYSEYTFHWDNQASGIFLTAVNISRTGALILLLPAAIWLSNHYRPSTRDLPTLDLSLIRISIIADIIGYIGYALAPSGFLFTLGGIIAALDSIALAVSEAALSKLAGKDRMGEVLGALGFLQACARIVGPTVAGITYSQTVGTTPNLVFWGFVATFGVAGVVTFVARLENAEGVGGKELGDEELGDEELGDEEEEVPLQNLSFH